MNAATCKISIITPTYNSEKYISKAIGSVISQTHQNWELLITDDCSTDNTKAILDEYSMRDSRIKVFYLDQNLGAAQARNNSLTRSTSKYIAFLDSDDFWHKEKLEKQLSFMDGNDYPITFTSYELVNEGGFPINKTIKSQELVTYHSYLKNTIIGMSTAMINCEKIKNFSFENIRTRQDTYLWISLLKRGFTAHGMKDVLCSYRVREQSISANKFAAAKQVWRLYYKFEKLGLFKSLYFFTHYTYNAIKKRLL